jgi:glucosamine--fructose-6-phosphate aminotransferase (isomerizing)
MGKFAEDGKHPHKVNCIERLVEKFTTESIKSTIGVAHTRWATCGVVSEENCHPHSDNENKVYLVHNGIINNHTEIKNKFLP